MAHVTPADASSTQTDGDASDDAVENASERAENHNLVGQAAPYVMRAMSRATYTSAYVLAYGVVYASVFVAKSVPQDNAFMHGLLDGSFAARDAVNDGTSAARDDLNQVT